MGGAVKIIILVIVVSMGLFFAFADKNAEIDGPADVADVILPGGDEPSPADLPEDVPAEPAESAPLPSGEMDQPAAEEFPPVEDDPLPEAEEPEDQGEKDEGEGGSSILLPGEEPGR